MSESVDFRERVILAITAKTGHTKSEMIYLGEINL